MKIGQKWIIAKKQLLDLLDQKRRTMEVFGPVKMPDGEVTFQAIRGADEITFDYVNEFDPLKRFLLPTKEVMLQFDLSQKRPALIPPPDPKPQLLFGVRSCDVQGFAHMDKFFSGAYHDDLYWKRRQQLVVISMACNKPLETCFCICCNGGPYLESGFDVQLTDFGDRFLAEIGSAKGVELLQPLENKLDKANARDESHREALMRACDEKMTPTAYLAKAVIAITNNRVNETLWEEMGAECFSCGGCTHVCPCCTCFDVQDCMTSKETGYRFRCWDSCQYSGFTREASGHNPRMKTKERVKRRFYHKLSYAYIRMDGHPGCVGCGRCITVCQAFGLLDIAAVVKRIRRDGQVPQTMTNAKTAQV